MGKIIIDGKEHEARQTAGALLDTKQELGFDPLFDYKRMDFEAMTVLAWCSLRATARRNGGSFEMSLKDFADRVDVKQVSAWFSAENPPATVEGGDSEKKD